MNRAMKSIKKKSILKEEEERMFAEMNILKDLDHPNILKLFELYQDENNYYLITEYCNGGELFEKIKNMNSFTEKMAAEYMKQILSAVVYCHTKNIVHRDLKPENLLLDSKKPNASIKVIDFGTSRKFSSTKKMSKRLGTPYYIAPEVLDQNYDEKCDVWSCGVILYILLCGYPPFGGSTENEILNKVKSGKFKFDDDDWSGISMDAKNLIKKMLTYNAKERISALEALNDKWIQANACQNTLNIKVLSNLSGFHAKNKLKQAILSFIATQVVSQVDKEDLQKAFKALDKDSDGKLTRDELIEGYMKLFNNKTLAEEEVDKIIKEVDHNMSGSVDFTEFIMASMAKEKLLSKTRIEQAFKMFDLDGNGFISKSEIETILGGAEMDELTWKNMLDDCDTNKDGQISQTEFIDLLLKKFV
jgi:calcium-dependent protein kinase